MESVGEGRRSAAAGWLGIAAVSAPLPVSAKLRARNEPRLQSSAEEGAQSRCHTAAARSARSARSTPSARAGRGAAQRRRRHGSHESGDKMARRRRLTPSPSSITATGSFAHIVHPQSANPRRPAHTGSRKHTWNTSPLRPTVLPARTLSVPATGGRITFAPAGSRWRLFLVVWFGPAYQRQAHTRPHL